MNPAQYIGWAPGYGAKIKAEDAHSELERIRAEHDGELTADIVVAEAKPEESVLHEQIYDRGQRAAATEYYKTNARKLIHSVVVTYEYGPEEGVRVYSVVRETPSKIAKGRTMKVYGSTEEALQDPGQRNYVLANALRDAASWRKKYAALSELAKIFTVIDEVAEAIL